MSYRAWWLLGASSLLFAGCGLSLDFAPPDDAGLDGSLDAATRDASSDTGEPRDASADALDPHDDGVADVSIDAPTPPDDAGLACAEHADCEGGFCVAPCDGGPRRCEAAAPCAESPVCGCDGQNYASACHAREAGVEVSADANVCAPICAMGDPSSCPVGAACRSCPGEVPACVPAPAPVCSDRPVCGCDGHSYLGNCAALDAGVRMFTPGLCSPGMDCFASSDCDLGEYCARASCGEALGTCTTLPVTIRPLVCGCSGRRYLSSIRALLREGLVTDCDTCPRSPSGAGCCADSADCTTGSQTCIGAPTAAGGCLGLGSCVILETTMASAGTCWTDEDCEAGTCVGAQICPCGTTCFVPDSPGRCTP